MNWERHKMDNNKHLVEMFFVFDANEHFQSSEKRKNWCFRACDKSQQQKIPLQSWFIQKRNKTQRKIHWVAKLNSSPNETFLEFRYLFTFVELMEEWAKGDIGEISWRQTNKITFWRDKKYKARNCLSTNICSWFHHQILLRNEAKANIFGFLLK